MGQMTAGQVLAQVDDLLPNSYPGEQKRRWLRQAEGFVLEEVVRAPVFFLHFEQLFEPPDSLFDFLFHNRFRFMTKVVNNT